VLFDKITDLVPHTDAQRTLQAEAESMAINLGQTRWLLFAQSGTSISTPFLVIVVFWLTVLYLSFGLFAPRNATAFITLLISALSVAGAMFLILDLDHPFSGFMQIPDTPLRNANRGTRKIIVAGVFDDLVKPEYELSDSDTWGRPSRGSLVEKQLDSGRLGVSAVWIGTRGPHAGALCRFRGGMYEFLYSRTDRIGLSALTDLIGFLANPHQAGHQNVSPLRPTAIPTFTVLEFMLRA
jgi:hypothetical protein